MPISFKGVRWRLNDNCVVVIETKQSRKSKTIAKFLVDTLLSRFTHLKGSVDVDTLTDKAMSDMNLCEFTRQDEYGILSFSSKTSFGGDKLKSIVYKQMDKAEKPRNAVISSMLEQVGVEHQVVAGEIVVGAYGGPNLRNRIALSETLLDYVDFYKKYTKGSIKELNKFVSDYSKLQSHIENTEDDEYTTPAMLKLVNSLIKTHPSIVSILTDKSNKEIKKLPFNKEFSWEEWKGYIEDTYEVAVLEAAKKYVVSKLKSTEDKKNAEEEKKKAAEKEKAERNPFKSAKEYLDFFAEMKAAFPDSAMKVGNKQAIRLLGFLTIILNKTDKDLTAYTFSSRAGNYPRKEIKVRTKGGSIVSFRMQQELSKIPAYGEVFDAIKGCNLSALKSAMKKLCKTAKYIEFVEDNIKKEKRAEFLGK